MEAEDDTVPPTSPSAMWRLLVAGAWVGVMDLNALFFASMVLTGRNMLMLLSTVPGGRGEDQYCKSEISTWWPWLASVIFG
jgi:hypothetical protein